MKKLLCSVLAVLLLLVMLPGVASAAPASKREVKRSIAIVFDNSGSMYTDAGAGQQARYAWCRATYAMEAFAAMMNQNDVMHVYPMHPIEVDGTTYTMEEPLKVTQATSETIRRINSPQTGTTPIESITCAYEGLKKETADEKWLIVLTDGDVFYRDNSNLKGSTGSALGSMLTEYNQDVNVIYLGIGAKVAKPSGMKPSGTYQYHEATPANTADVLVELSGMCNTIFGRAALPNPGKTVSFDVSMSKLIVFVQGENIQNVKLSGHSPVDSKAMKYSEKGTTGQYATGKDCHLPDTSLQGMMLTYTDLAAGDYTLSFDGTESSISCYYEPDVDLQARLVDGMGNVADPNGQLISGGYNLEYCLVDRNGKQVNSSLMGKTSYQVKYTLNGKTETVNADKAGSIPLEIKPNDTLDAEFRVTYLDGFTIAYTSDEMGWPDGGLKFAPPPAGTLEVEIQGIQGSYNLTDMGKSTFRLNFIYNGEACTSEQLGRIDVGEPKLTGGNATAKVDKDDQGYFVTLEGGPSLVETECGQYDIQVSGVYTNEDNLKTNVATDNASFKLVDNSRKLEMKVQTPQTYYQLSELKNSKPIKALMTYSGDKLTKEELDALKFSYTVDGAELLVEKDYDNSAFLVRFDPANPPASGKYTVQLSARGVNEIGRELTVEGESHVEFGTLPMWLRILLPIAIILLIALIVFLILNQKVLPKNVELRDGDFRVDGESVKGSKAFIEGGGKRKGTIKIKSANYTLDPGATQLITMEVEAITNRVTPVKSKKYKILSISFKGQTQVRSWEVKGMKFKPDPNKPGQFLSVSKNAGFKPIENAGPRTPFFVKVETRNGASVSFKGTVVNK